MTTIEIEKAILQITTLLENAAQGEDIIITRNDEPFVKLSSLKPIKKRLPLFGSDKDIISISDDFEDPLSDFDEYQ